MARFSARGPFVCAVRTRTWLRWPRFLLLGTRLLQIFPTSHRSHATEHFAAPSRRKIQTGYIGLFRTQSHPKGGPSPGCGSSKRAGFLNSTHCISLEWGAAARKLSHGRLKTPARGAGMAGHCPSSVTPKIQFLTVLFRKSAIVSHFFEFNA